MTPSAQHLEPLAVDGANGIGAMKLSYIRQKLAKYLQIEIFNNGSKGQLNEKVTRREDFSDKIAFIFMKLVWCRLCENISESPRWFTSGQIFQILFH